MHTLYRLHFIILYVHRYRMSAYYALYNNNENNIL